jgi:hypothetical protein
VDEPGASAKQAKAPTRVLPLLPSSDIPLAEQMDDLVTLAETGDPTASCRLIIGANRCSEQARNAKFTERTIRSLEHKPGRHEGLGIHVAAISMEIEAKSSAYCAGVDLDSLPRAGKVLANAYAFLSPRQKTILALMRSDGVIRRLESEPDLSEMALYVYPQALADNAYAFLQSGIQAHDPLALEGMMLVHSPGLSLGPRGAGLWLPNPRLFLKYSFMLARLYGEQALGRAANMVHSTMLVTDPLDLEKIRREADFESGQWLKASGSTPIARPQPDDNLGDC